MILLPPLSVVAAAAAAAAIVLFPPPAAESFSPLPCSPLLGGRRSSSRSSRVVFVGRGGGGGEKVRIDDDDDDDKSSRSRTTTRRRRRPSLLLHLSSSSAAVSDDPSSSSSSSSPSSSAAAAAAGTASTSKRSVLSAIASSARSSRGWGEAFFDDAVGPEATFHALFSGIRRGGASLLGPTGTPFKLEAAEVLDAFFDSGLGGGWSGGEGGEGTDAEADANANAKLEGFFTYDDLVKAVGEDFLDADRGSTDNRRGWKVTSVSKPRGDSFEDARMTKEEVDAALGKGTVILSAAGAHIPKLAGATLACTDASSLPCALNLYVTASGLRTSAPPHTDRQDVIVVQTEGAKRWRVYSPPDPTSDPDADMFARGKGDDDLPLYALDDGRLGSELLLDATLRPGDVLFVPAAFPHTTDTVVGGGGGDNDDGPDATSVHLTFNFDTYVWDLDYLSARRLALRRAGVTDWALGQFGLDDNRYVGKANRVEPAELRGDLFRALPLGLLDDDGDGSGGKGEGEGEGAGASPTTTIIVDEVASELERISRAVDEETAALVPTEIWAETVLALRRQGVDLMDVHRDMYLAAVDEGRTRRSEEGMTSHLTGDALVRARAMTPEKMQRLSVFRVRDYFERIKGIKEELVAWSESGEKSSSSSASGEDGGGGGGDVGSAGGGGSPPPENWEFTLPLKAGDEVEADLGGAYFPATVTKVSPGGRYDVRFFDGDVMDGLGRDMIKLLKAPPPSSASGEEEPPRGLTKKELKRWRKKREKKSAKGL